MITVIMQRTVGTGLDRTNNKVLARLLTNELKRLTPIRTGRLRSNWRIGYITGRSIEIYNKIPYGVYVNNGTEYIKPRRFVERAIRAFQKKYPELLNDYNDPQAEYEE